MDVPIEILDREVARAANKLERARDALSRGEIDAMDNPLTRDRRVSSRATYLELAEAPASPLRDALREWIAALTLERVLWADTVRIEAARRADEITIEHPGIEPMRVSTRALVLMLLGEPEPGRREVWADALARGAVASANSANSANASRFYAERRVEAARLLSVELDALELPCDPGGALAEAAERFLQITEPFVPRGLRWHAVIAGTLARDAGEGWPARIGTRWIADLFGPTGLTDGLSLHLGPLPAPIGAASFARALARFGVAYARAATPRGAPFSLARAPFDLREARRAALFAALTADPVFAIRALGLGRARARDQARRVARALIVGLRLDAARVLLRGALVSRDRAAWVQERTAHALGDPIPPSLAGVLPRLRPSDGVSFAGALVAMRDRRELIERFDEDWFRSPHAAHALRDEDSLLANPRRADQKALADGLAALEHALAALE